MSAQPKFDPQATIPDHKQAMSELMRTCLEVANPISPRMRQQLEIEGVISRFNPDCVEAVEILDALVAAVQRRYGEECTTDVEETYRDLRKAIEEVEPTSLSPEDL